VCGAGPEICCNKQNQRPYDAQWARNIRDLCSKNAIPFYSTHFNGDKELLDGVAHNEVPPLRKGDEA
jgi:protein gp37